MRYVRDHKLRTRNRIIESASLGLRRTGAKGLSVADLMKLAGLTHGGFYSHFSSRDDLVAEVMAFAMDRTTTSWAQLAAARPFEERFDVIVAHYLSAHHRDNPEQGCALPALGADIGRSSPKARGVFARKLEQMIDLVARQLPIESRAQARQIATSTIATMLGSIVLARAVDGKKLSNSILEAGRETISKQTVVQKLGRRTTKRAAYRQP